MHTCSPHFNRAIDCLHRYTVETVENYGLSLEHWISPSNTGDIINRSYVHHKRGASSLPAWILFKRSTGDGRRRSLSQTTSDMDLTHQVYFTPDTVPFFICIRIWVSIRIGRYNLLNPNKANTKTQGETFSWSPPSPDLICFFLRPPPRSLRIPSPP